jgi:DNA modification methylase
MSNEYVKLYQGDCLDRMREIQNGSVDMILADPPYGTTACKWDSVIPLEPMWAQLKRLIKPNGAIVLHGSQPFTSALIMSNIKMFKYCWIWEKSQAVGHLNAWRQPLRCHEEITVFYYTQVTYNPEIIDKDPKNIRPLSTRTKKSDCYGNHKLDVHKCPPNKSMPKSILRFENAQKTLHPTQKPVALAEYLIKTYTEKGETVLDFTMGSGTTGVAAMNTGRKFIGIELDKDYFKIAENRILAAFNQAIFQNEIEQKSAQK